MAGAPASRASSLSLGYRATIAVALTIGFYLMAISIAAGLLFIAYQDIRGSVRIHGRLVLLCFIGAGIILWSIFPRREKFVPPGALLDPSTQPRLFALVAEIARAVQQKMPGEVYLTPEMNAWVTERGGGWTHAFSGLRSQRVMGLGLPLLQILTVNELRAVLAHEFGHYHGGDTTLGPWIYKTRKAIGRTIEGLSGQSWLLAAPFNLYGKLFLRITHAVSRSQEYAADQLAAKTCGSRSLINGLKNLHGKGCAFEPFWINEVVPVLSAGYHPPLAEGFSRFIQAPLITEAITSVLNEESRLSKADPYDTHPPLQERIAAVESWTYASNPPGDDAASDPPAASILDGLDDLEKDLLIAVGGKERAGSLKPIHWEEVAMKVHLPAWEKLAGEQETPLSRITPASLPEIAREIKKFAKDLKRPAGQKLSPEEAEDFSYAVVGAALAVALISNGWALEASPGTNISCRKGEEVIEPFEILPRLVAGRISREEWMKKCSSAGIEDLHLGK